VPALAGALLELWRDEPARRRMAEAARRDACKRFALRRQLELVQHTYGAALETAA
jgi:hypothetical protein